MKNENYLLTYSGNWGDEIDVDGFIIIDNNYKNYITNYLTNYLYPIQVDIGFNESVDYDNGEELLQEITFQKITKNELKTIEKFFNSSNDFGNNLLLSITQSSKRNKIDNPHLNIFTIHHEI